MLKLYGVLTSRAARNVWTLYETDQPFERVPVIQTYRLADPATSDRMHTQSPEFRKLSPQAAIPVLVDGDLVLTESLAINFHLVKKVGGPIGPQSPAEEALMLQWALYGVAAIEAEALAILNAVESGGDQARVASAKAALTRPMRVLDDQLATGYLVGDRFTIADLNMAEIVRYLRADAAFLAKFPNVMSWLDECQARPAFQRMWSERANEVV